ncbi:MAG: hypothetical protein FD165_2213 [Gammaproteobacteria bacterium]|nr:MAG: hypothetical protein FD165_2213 [Gammaproteobacteria bacterium]TND03263.1 MAG: hypothetical protein FD120_1936 [Gammaproteobacteria bacterium]
MLLEVRGVIGPAAGDYIKRGLEKARDGQAELAIIQIDTPGGLDTSMRQIIQEILASPVPVAVYVTPAGARAASAGTYILYAAHVAAMSPGTNLGAATPVQIAAPGMPGDKGGGDDSKAADKEGHDDAMKRKIVNDAVAYIRGLAQLRGRNVEWAAQAVRDAASLSAEDALKEGVIEYIADGVPALLAQLDGKKVSVLGEERELHISGMTVQRFDPDWRTRLLTIITDPNVAYILMLVGIYGLIYEFANPGMVLPGVAGTICLLLALFAFHVLPINYAGLGLMLLGIAFMIGEVFVPSFGALGIGGVIAFVIGSIILLDTGAPGFGISYPLIAAFAFLNAGFFIFFLGMAIKARRRPVVSGHEQMIGSVGEVLEDFEGNGRIRVHGEIWGARSAVPLKRGQNVCVTEIHGLTLDVKADDQKSSEEIE